MYICVHAYICMSIQTDTLSVVHSNEAFNIRTVFRIINGTHISLIALLIGTLSCL